METEFKDWEKIKSIVNTYGLSINKPNFAKHIIQNYNEEHLMLSKVFGNWVELYTDIINQILLGYPNMPLKYLLNDSGSYTTIEDLKYLQEENINLIIGESDSELVERLKDIINKTSHKLPNT